jgi:hypothetical protein
VNRCQVSPDILGEQSDHRMAKAITSPWIEILGPAALRRACPLGTIRMVPTEIEEFWDLVEGSIEAHLGDQCAVGVMIAPMEGSTAQDVYPHHAIEIIAAQDEQHIPESYCGVPGVGGKSILTSAEDIAFSVNIGLPCVTKHDLRSVVQRLNASQQQVTTVQVVMRGPLKVFTPGLLDDEVVIWRRSQVDGLTKIADARITGRVASTDLLGTICRRVVGDDELEVRVALAQQCIKGVRQVFLSVIDRKANAQPRYLAQGFLRHAVNDQSPPEGDDTVAAFM